jgi:transposase-like protein
MKCWCGKQMVKNGKLSGKQRFICPKGHTVYDKDDYEPKTKQRLKKMLKWWL